MAGHQHKEDDANEAKDGNKGLPNSDTGDDDDKKEDAPFKASIEDDETGNTRFFIFLVIAVGCVLLIYMAYINRAKVRHWVGLLMLGVVCTTCLC